MRWAFLMATLSLAVAPIPAAAQQPTPAPAFPDSLKVWVNTRSGVYHCFGSRYWRATAQGALLVEREARAKGYRPAYGRTCEDRAPARLAAGDPGPDRRLLSVSVPADTARGPQVWVNTRSGVYHCPGSRSYGSTRAGRHMTEREARGAGYRPAYGRACR